ncbi:DUF6482 family protein [Pseudomonas sp. LS1212]|uniref:DUF6482 family protein n=1 Tax=Pseudomonas sp. LS1212 TaxID=2972478 RepID=UPI00215CE71B|nr:DUF6482 family protein [Pseudomonas sp. LS1212]UVJ43375.1 DUF6482 family protein [Pseudomonas sp. LS1212]
MNFHELTGHAKAGRIDELNLISLEGGIYLLEARMHGAAHPLNDAHGQALPFRSVEHAREVLHPLSDLGMNLVHWSVHDEMCGMKDTAEEDLRIPIAFRSSRGARVG